MFDNHTVVLRLISIKGKMVLHSPRRAPAKITATFVPDVPIKFGLLQGFERFLSTWEIAGSFTNLKLQQKK